MLTKSVTWVIRVSRFFSDRDYVRQTHPNQGNFSDRVSRFFLTENTSHNWWETLRYILSLEIINAFHFLRFHKSDRVCLIQISLQGDKTCWRIVEWCAVQKGSERNGIYDLTRLFENRTVGQTRKAHIQICVAYSGVQSNNSWRVTRFATLE